MSTDSVKPENSEKLSQSQIDRRTAMKAALGGAVVAAAWSAPKIEGLSLSPDYASAASQTTVNPVSPGTSAAWFTHNSQTAGASRCVGAGSGISCNTWNATQVSYAIPSTTESFTLNAALSGQVKNTGSTSVTLSGVTNANYTCSVNISGNCNESSGNVYGGNYAFSGGGNYTLSAANPTINSATTCTGSMLFIDSHVTINVACTYGTP